MDTAVSIPVNAPGVLEFYQERDLIWLLLQALTIALPAFLLLTGRAARLREACAKLARGRAYPTLLLFAAAYLTLSALVVLPVAYWLEVAHWVAWKLPVSGPGEWLAGRAGILVAQVIGAALLIWIPFALIRRTPRWWWLGTATIAWLLVSALLITEQVWIRPMTTQIVPLPEGPLKTKFDAIAARCGSDRVPVYIGGHDNTVVGAGPTRHILISKHEIDHAPTAENEVVSTFAHELKHYLSADPELALAVVAVLFLVGALGVHVLGGAAIRLWGARFGFDSLADPAALPLMMAILVPYWVFCAQPALNAVQRHVEWQADRFALEVTQDNRSRAAQLARELTTHAWRLHEHYGFFKVFRATHPSDADRVRLALTYQPWKNGGPGEFDELCERLD